MIILSVKLDFLVSKLPEFLERQNVQVDAKNNHHETPLQLAVKNGDLK